MTPELGVPLVEQTWNAKRGRSERLASTLVERLTAAWIKIRTMEIRD
ncbi:hypothetical protein [Nocardia sp. NRRL S-836]|nr:hypothetical protein [Nocardia sp. NRRL S-836]